jgi:citrate lyase alpha subunit
MQHMLLSGITKQHQMTPTQYYQEWDTKLPMLDTQCTKNQECKEITSFTTAAERKALSQSMTEVIHHMTIGRDKTSRHTSIECRT